MITKITPVSWATNDVDYLGIYMSDHWGTIWINYGSIICSDLWYS